ncbi:MAG: hypothetical protein CVT89_00750 [Candidatus Altiarchaeales archaeon HGW-Altiarchaeales-2]|nr:MAG: hypothetical protein CVT89_00750 [Candidatus Altiarchaeales archaeon HGW-Altiarchaeales-2]
MLQALKYFGKNVVEKEGFKSKLQAKVKTGDKIIILNIDQNLSLKKENIIEYNKKEEYPYSFYYKGGNDSVTGATGVMGVSPFFLIISNITENKIIKSSEYNEEYKRMYSFRLDPKYQQYLKNDEFVDKELIYSFKDKGIILSENTKIFNTGERGWDIKLDESLLYKIEIDKDKQIIICVPFISEFLEFLKTNIEEIKSIGKGYLFSWDDAPGKDSKRLLKFLKDNLKIEWAENAEIKKSDDDKVITITKENNSLTIKFNKEENKAILKINDEETYEYILKKENSKINICCEEEAKWVYFNSFKGKSTEDIHKKFIDYNIEKATRNKQIKNINGKCSLCGEMSELCYPQLEFFSLDVSNYNHNLVPNDIDNSRFRVCKNCESNIVSGWNYISNLFSGQYVLIPKLRGKSSSNELLKEFIKIVKADISDFEKLNEVLNHRMDKEIELSFIVMKKGKQKISIEKFVGNYKTFAIRFEEEYLIKDNELKYVDRESKNISIQQISSFFELERILKYFFVNDKNFSLYQKFYIYNLYNQDLPKDMDSNFKHLLYMHRDELFSFIYETNISALKRKTLNEICLNFLLYEIRKQREFWGKNADENVRLKIMESLNYYYFIKNKIINEYKMKGQIIDLKSKFEMLGDENIKEDDIKRPEIFSEIQKMVEQDNRILYYLIGQFIRKIDNKRGYAKKNKIFDDFIQNINRKNIKQRFAEDILKKQNYYIKQLNPRAKLVFDVMSNNMDNLFEYEPYEEIVIYIITGYYSNNMLK